MTFNNLIEKWRSLRCLELPEQVFKSHARQYFGANGANTFGHNLPADWDSWSNPLKMQKGFYFWLTKN